jgi:hypothetical protein
MSSLAHFVAAENRVERQFVRDTENRDGTLETNTVNQGGTLLLLYLWFFLKIRTFLR